MKSESAEGPVERLISPRERDLGGFTVRRVLPHAARRTVGPFIFFDQMGPTPAGAGLDVRPHPHIGLSTVTYLFEGAARHRDSLGIDQIIRPGDVNWMTAGRGIVHSERSDDETRAVGPRLFGIQSWVALPKAHEEDAPAFAHHPAATLPAWSVDGGRLRLIAGTAYGRTSPVETAAPLFYVDAELDAQAAIALPAEHAERAVYVAVGGGAVVGAAGEETPVEAGTMAVLRPGVEARFAAKAASRVMLLGGAPLDGPRFIWWNFVSSSRARIERAKADWREGRFGVVPGDTEAFIPLPDTPGP